MKEKFQCAVLYAQSVRDTNPELKAQYEANRMGKQSAFNVAFIEAYKHHLYT